MDDTVLTRRHALGGALALGTGGLLLPRLVVAAGTDGGGYEVIANAFGASGQRGSVLVPKPEA